MENEHRIINKIKISTFKTYVKKYTYDNIEANNHAFFRLSQKQRGIYTEDALKKIIWNEKPVEVGIEINGNYNIIYNHKNGKMLRIILNLSTKKLYIVTFYFLNKREEVLFKNG